jgi:hypothetical protein
MYIIPFLEYIVNTEYDKNDKYILNSFEVIEIVEEYLHLVQLVGDYYAKDIYVPVNRKEVT